MQNRVSKLLQTLISLRIPFRLSRPVMHPTVYFNYDADFMTIKVDNVAINWNLSAKLQPQCPAIFQLNPGSLLCSSILTPHLACAIQKNFWGIRFWPQYGTPHPALRATLSRRERDSSCKHHADLNFCAISRAAARALSRS